ncbi:MAG TPA: alpha/beta hydrolase [Candidatus Binataceae bacterium]|nr:alpha/beta hydrolase [Candidatus Binataceae bacterium]
MERQDISTSMPRLPYLAAKDGTALYYKDWGTGTPVLFVASWAMNSDLWQYQMVPLVEQGLRCIAYDRRGHGRSSQPGHGYDYDTLADDLAAVIEQLDLRDLTLVGHSMGPGEMVRYLTRHGSSRVRKLVFIAPTTPFILQTADNLEGVPGSMFEQTREIWRRDFPKWLADNARPFVMPDTSDQLLQWGIDQMFQASMLAIIECNKAVVETDFRAELPRIKLPTLIIHGTADMSAPLEITARRTAKLMPNNELKIYEGAPHGVMLTHVERINNDLLDFIRREG